MTPTARHLRSFAIVLLVLLTWGCGGGTKKQPETARGLDVTGKVRLAQAYIEKGRLAEALSTLREAIEQEPGNASVRKYYGQVCFLSGRHEEAERAFLKALELDPYLTDTYNDLGALYDKTGRKDEAERAFRRALEDPAYPTPQKAHLNLGLLYLSQGRTEEAISQMRRAVEIDPKYYQAHYELASLLDRNDRLEEAAREYEVAAPAYRSSGEYHFRLGVTYMRLGQKDKARLHFNRAIEVSPGSIHAARAADLLKMMD